MANVDVDTSAFEESVRRTFESAENEVFDIVLATAYEIRNGAVRNTPVRTGVLRAAWQVEANKDGNGGVIDIINGTEYRDHVEYGTKNMAPRPMIRPVLQQQLDLLVERLKGL